MSSPIISIENLSKAYRIGLKEEVSDSLVGAIQGVIRAPWKNWRRLRRLNTFEQNGDADDTIWALKDVSFDVAQGEVVGIIGRNGAGKSTLLKILSRITEPTSGRAVIRGRVSSLLEVGTGFHPELSGRENIYMNGTILGMTKREIDRKFDDIVDFSGVEKFLDTPIKRYSSGMQVRLAFSVAAHLEPEILIIDEVLAVGDAEFQKRCLGKMQDVASGGRTVLFVSHNMASVEALCNECVEIKSGTVSLKGRTHTVINRYRNSLFAATEFRAHERKNGCYFRQVTIIDQNGVPTQFVPLGGNLLLRMEIDSPKTNGALIGIGFDDSLGTRLLTVHSPALNSVNGTNGQILVDCAIERFPLAPGQYTLKLGLTAGHQQLESIDNALSITVLDGNAFGEGRGFHRGVCVVPTNWSVVSQGTAVFQSATQQPESVEC